MEGQLSWRNLSKSGWIVWLGVAVPSFAQIPFPQIYAALHSGAHAVITGHQWWRLLTSLVVQDGGIIATVSDLVLLAVNDGHGIAIGLGDNWAGLGGIAHAQDCPWAERSMPVVTAGPRPIGHS